MKIREFIKKNTIPLSIIAIVLGAVIVSISVAYFTSGTETIVNVFAAGNIKIDVVEDDWDPNGPAKTANPNQTISKDPFVRNTGANPAYVFLRIENPKKAVRIVADDKITVSDFHNAEMFKYDITANWVLIDDSETTDEYHAYVYAYIGGIVEPNEQTTPLFNEVTVVNYLEGTLPVTENIDLIVKGLAIQSENTPLVGATPKEQMTNLYNSYLKK